MEMKDFGPLLRICQRNPIFDDTNGFKVYESLSKTFGFDHGDSPIVVEGIVAQHARRLQ